MYPIVFSVLAVGTVKNPYLLVPLLFKLENTIWIYKTQYNYKKPLSVSVLRLNYFTSIIGSIPIC